MDARWRLVPVAVGAWAATATGTLLSPQQSIVVAAVALVVGLLAIRRASVLAALAIGAALGGGSAAVHVHHLRVGPVPRLADRRSEVEVIARLVRDPTPVTTAGGSALTITDATVTSVWTGRWHSTDAPILVLSYGSGWAGLLPGQRVDVSGTLAPPRPGDDVAAVFDARGRPGLVGRPPWWQRVAGHARVGLRSASAGLPADERGLLPSLVDGDESAVPAALQNDMRITGLTHLEAVSGENVSVTLALALSMARGVGLRRRGRVVLCAIVLVGFVLLARPSPSVLRAAVMGTVALLGLLLGRRASALPALSAAVVVLVVVNPFLARSIGFVLSVVATAALVTIAPVWTGWLERRLPRPFAIAVAVPAAAQLACTPVLIVAFGRLTPYAVPANLLAALGVVPATVLGVATAVLASISVPLGQLAAWLGAVPTAWIAGVARDLAGLPGAGLHASATIGIGLAIALTAAAVCWLASRRRQQVVAQIVGPPAR